MGFKTDHSFDKDGETIFDMYNDEAYLRAKWEAMDHKDISISLENDGTTFTIKSERNVPANVPGFARKFLSDRNVVAQTDTWTWLGDGNAEGTWTVEVKGAPVKMTGTTQLTQHSDSSCTNTIAGEAKVSIPLVGGKVAAFVHEDTLKSLEEDLAFTLEYIKNNM